MSLKPALHPSFTFDRHDEVMKAATAPRPIVCCDDCGQVFEVFSDLSKAAACIGGRPHRHVRLQRAA